ncbi:MAG TPA: ABC transporter ATP-binding protein [Miltoncostaeaceae bacterium]|nr:ABC transporter ATP-binding protein [Miltoncostaeaceae bacterium]
MSALELTDVRRVYGSGSAQVVALEHATLAVDEGEMVALLGPSGSGKRTLLSIAGGLLAPTSGSVRVGGRELAHLGARELTRVRRERIGFVFQAVNLVPFLTARENLLVVDELAGRRGRGAHARADRLLQELDLADRATHFPDRLSGGERQRVAIGRALMNQPAVVLVDEPTSALDTARGERVMELLRREVTDRGTAAVVVTHDRRMTRFADRTLTIEDGVLRAPDEGPPTAG